MTLANGYEMKTTFWNDFSIADKFGLDAIQDTYNRALKEWKNDIVYMTELVIVLNHKIWAWFKEDENFARIYDKLWREADEFIYENFSEEDISYYLKISD